MESAVIFRVFRGLSKNDVKGTTMNYIGSKHSLLDFLETSIKKVVGTGSKVFCDLFVGTGAVGTHFKKLGYQIIANDFQYYSYVLNRYYIGNHRPLQFDGLQEVTPQSNRTLFESRTNNDATRHSN